MTTVERDKLDGLLDAALDAYFPLAGDWERRRGLVLAELQAIKDIHALTKDDKAETAIRAVERCGRCRLAAARSNIKATWLDRDWVGVGVFRNVAKDLLASRLPLSESQVLRMLRAAGSCGRHWNEFFMPFGRISTTFARFAEGNGISPEMEIAARAVQDQLDKNNCTLLFRTRIEDAIRVGKRRRATLSADAVPTSSSQREDSHSSEASSLLDDLLEVCQRCHGLRDSGVQAVYGRIRGAPVAVQRVFLRLGFDRVAAIARACGGDREHRFWHLLNFHFTTAWATGLSECLAGLLNRKLPLDDADFLALVRSCVEYGVVSSDFMPHIGALCGALARHYADTTPPDQLVDAIGRLALTAGLVGNAPEQRIKHRLLAITKGRQPYPMMPGEAWSDRAIADLNGVNEDHRCVWVQLLEHCTAAAGARPSAKWTAAAVKLLEHVGASAFIATIVPWLDLVDKPRTQDAPPRYHGGPDESRLIDDGHADILKGLCWIAGTIASPDLARALGRLALSCYRKVPGIGPRAVKVGNAAVYALGRMPGRDSLAQLAMLRVKVKFGTAQKMLEKALAAAAEREGLPREDIDELAVPAYGLTDVGLREEPLGDFAAILRVERSGKCELTFRKEGGKIQKSVPAAVKESHADDLKELKAAAKDIGSMLPAQRERIDSLFLQDKSWDLATWRERYLDHPLVGVVARRLIWRFAPARDGAWDAAAPARSAIWLDGPGLTGLDGEPLATAEADRVRLWHPIEVPQEEILAWREFLESREIVQPFKQAHREVYLLTDAERNTRVYSNRYAAHILRQHQFNALCAARNWKNKLRLMVDDEYPPAMRPLPAWGLRAEFWVEGAGEEHGRDTNEAGVYNHVATDQVRFYAVDTGGDPARTWGGRYQMYGALADPIPLDTIPPLVFSEIMRDVDLFVGVASVGNNPAWQDGGPEGAHRDYWWSYSFGDLSGTAETRRDILARVLPRLKIAERGSLDGKFLRVRGDIRTYNIHLGSGNILMEPNDQYLCIVPGRADPALPQKLYLPFDGDRTLSIILSKAFLLADDTKISDPTITQQIRGR